MSSVAHSPPEQGQLVSVRSRQWIVNDVRPSTLPPPALQPSFHGPQHLLTLASVEDDGLGEELQVIWEIEPGARVIEKVALLATDAASEGLDLQNHCSRLIHYEIPWNPNRMEQRNGRIDRHGQRASQVNVYHFVAQGYKDRERRNFSESASDLEADLEFLMRVVRKIETIREDLGKVGPVIAQQVEEALAAATGKEPSFNVKDRLLVVYPRLAPALSQALQARTEDRTTGLQKKLGERADKEADDIRAILTELKRAIEEELDQPEAVQLTLFDEPEREQFERNKLALQSRLKEIPAEIERETAAVRARYDNPQPRMFPVAVTFLVPERVNHE
jgi:superfamily II DNA/RNA helicase